MIEKLLFVLICFGFFWTLDGQAQERRKTIVGRIVSDSLTVDKVHIVNKNSQQGTYTNSYGDFAIPVQLDDTLVFSSIQFNTYRRIISEIDLRQLQLIIALQSKTNELEEVIVKSVSYTKGLDLPNANKKPLVAEENRLNAHNKSSAPVVALATLLNQRGGIDNLFYLLSGQRKRDRKLRSLKNQEKLEKQKLETANLIRSHFGDDFFIDSLKLSEEQIDDFIQVVLTDEVAKLFVENRFLELTEVFFTQVKVYLIENKSKD